MFFFKTCLTKSMKLNEMKENELAKKKNTVVSIKRGEEETLQGVEI